MSSVYRETYEELEGPWLLNREALRDIDDIFDAIEEEHKELLRTKAVSRVESRLKDLQDPSEDSRRQIEEEELGRHRVSRELRIDLDSAEYMDLRRFSETEDHQQSTGAKLSGFTYDLKVDHLSHATVYVRKHSSSAELYVECPSAQSETSSRSFSRLLNWAVRNQEPWWMRKLAKMSEYWTIFLMLSFMVPTMFAMGSVSLSKVDYWPDAEQVLQDGISEAEMQVTLEAIARKTFAIPKKNVETGAPQWWVPTIIAGVLVSILLRFRPKVVLEIGIGQSYIRRWRSWYRFLVFTAPGLIFTSIVWPYLIDVTRSL